jgi:hypothetical protein
MLNVSEDKSRARTGQSPPMCLLSRRLYIASGATIPLFRLHECREYSA